MAVTGEWNRCPFCQTALWAPPPGADVPRLASELVGRKRCPRCGAELWVLASSYDAMFFIRQPGESWRDFLVSLAALISPTFGVSVSQMEVALKDMDSLDLVEFVMEVEEAMQFQQRDPSSEG